MLEALPVSRADTSSKGPDGHLTLGTSSSSVVAARTMLRWTDVGRLIRWVVLWSVIVAPGCASPVFVCEDNDACVGGRCEAVGHCSFPDEQCPSGHRYGDHSGSLSGQCVPGETTATDDATVGTTGTTDASTTGPDASGTTVPPPTTTSTGSSGTGATTDNPAGSLCEDRAILEETFDTWPLAPTAWSYEEQPGVASSVVDGVLHVSVDIPEGTTAYANAVSEATFSGSATVGFEVQAVPPESGGELYFGAKHGAGDSEILYGFLVSGSGSIESFLRIGQSNYTSRVNMDFDPVAHRWLRITVDQVAGAVIWETSPDMIAWNIHDEEAMLDPAFDANAAVLLIACGAYQGPFQLDTLCALDNAFICGV